MKPLEIRKLLLENKLFLKTLHECKSEKVTKTHLLKSTSDEANVLLHILFSITQGDIPIKKKDYVALENSKKLLVLNSLFENTVKFNKIIKSSLKEKMSLLLKFKSVYGILLNPLFKK